MRYTFEIKQGSKTVAKKYFVTRENMQEKWDQNPDYEQYDDKPEQNKDDDIDMYDDEDDLYNDETDLDDNDEIDTYDDYDNGNDKPSNG